MAGPRLKTKRMKRLLFALRCNAHSPATVNLAAGSSAGSADSSLAARSLAFLEEMKGVSKGVYTLLTQEMAPAQAGAWSRNIVSSRGSRVFASGDEGLEDAE